MTLNPALGATMAVMADEFYEAARHELSRGNDDILAKFSGMSLAEYTAQFPDGPPEAIAEGHRNFVRAAQDEIRSRRLQDGTDHIATREGIAAWTDERLREELESTQRLAKTFEEAGIDGGQSEFIDLMLDELNRRSASP